MKSPRFRIHIAALTFIMMPAVAGIVAVNASATCERFVRTYVTKPVRNRVSKTTAEAWREWGIAHPNWKPNPNLHRPKYVMNREESVEKVDFACAVPLIDQSMDGLFAGTDGPPLLNFQPMEATQITFPDEIPPEVAELTPEETWPPLGPLVPPILGSSPGGEVFPAVPPGGTITGGAVSEPASLVMVGTGLAMICLMLAMRLRTVREPGTELS
jgi:hypothetical protein